MHMNLPNKLGALGVMIEDAVEDALGEVSMSAAAFILTLSDRPWTTVTELIPRGQR